MPKTALIVDDSASARFILGRLLGEHELKVDTAESAEDALDYLASQRPDVIFMDHLMPGMDGFQAVQAIKANPATATIPIMMYTSQEGELYVGQARALGAVGVLPKQVKPVEVSKMLQSLHLISDRPETELEAAVEAVAEPESVDKTLQLDAGQSISEMLQDLFHQQRLVLREEIRHGYERLSEPPPAPPEKPDRRPRLLGIGLVITAVVAGWFLYLYLQAAEQWSEANERNATLLATVDQQRELIEAQQNTTEETTSSTGVLMTALPILEWGINQQSRYGFDEIALDDARGEMLLDLVGRLEELGFSGVVEFVVHVGRFCTVLGSSGVLELPEAGGGGLGTCTQIGWPDEEAVMLAERQTLGFANAVSAAGNSEAIDIDIVAMGHRAPVEPYPAETVELSAEDWNNIAEINQRVDVNLLLR